MSSQGRGLLANCHPAHNGVSVASPRRGQARHPSAAAREHTHKIIQGSVHCTYTAHNSLTLPHTPRGWQWLFIVEGIPSAVLGALVLLLLPSSVAAAKFLTPKEKAALEAEFARDSAPGPLGAGLQSTAALLRMVAGNFRLWVAFVAGALSSVSSHTYLTYVPILINSLLSGKVRPWLQRRGRW